MFKINRLDHLVLTVKNIDRTVEFYEKLGMTKEQALKLVLDPLYLATLMIKSGDADGEVAGAKNATGDVLRPALQIVKTLPGMSVVSGAFLLLTNKPEYGENGLIVPQKNWPKSPWLLPEQPERSLKSNRELPC